MTEDLQLSRRQLLFGFAAGAGALAAAPAFAGLSKPANISLSPVRSLSFANLHTGETLKQVTYFEYGNYIPDALTEINHLLRDHRTGTATKMDPKLLDLLHMLHRKLDSGARFDIISGYRSPKTNAMLANRSGGVAKKSLHMQGKAIDLKLADRSLTSIRDAAKSLKSGGVGHYSGQFVHVDTGRVRSW